MKSNIKQTTRRIAVVTGVSILTLNAGTTLVLAKDMGQSTPLQTKVAVSHNASSNSAQHKIHYTDNKAEADAARKAGYAVTTSKKQTTNTTRSPLVTTGQIPTGAQNVQYVKTDTVQDADLVFENVAWEAIPSAAHGVKQTGEETIHDPNQKFTDGVTHAELEQLREQGAINITKLPDKTITVHDPNQKVDTGITAAEIEKVKADGAVNIEQIPDAFQTVLDEQGKPKKVLLDQVPAGHKPTATDEKQTVVDGKGPIQTIKNTPENLQKLHDQGAVDITEVAGAKHDFTSTKQADIPADAQDVTTTTEKGTATRKVDIPATATNIQTLFVKDGNGSNLVLKDSSTGVNVADMTYFAGGKVYDLYESTDGKSELSNVQDSLNNGTGTLYTYHQFTGGGRINTGILSWAERQFKFKQMDNGDENISADQLANFDKDGVLVYKTSIGNYPVSGVGKSVTSVYMTLTPTGGKDKGDIVYTWNKFYYDKDNTIYYGVKEYTFNQTMYHWSITDQELSYRLPITHEETVYTYGEPLYAYELPVSHEEPLYAYELPASHQEKRYQYSLSQSHEEKLFQYDVIKLGEKLYYSWPEVEIGLKPREPKEPGADIAAEAGTTPAVMSELDFPATEPATGNLKALNNPTEFEPELNADTSARLPQTGVSQTDGIVSVIGAILLGSLVAFGISRKRVNDKR
ncbi:LPXTG cell wall anchor domain-containing protein [Periweissella cryptocerci]|nr:LPXTG cell wall anchor domain-containing protein [Periweissella cryptocerci]